MATWWQDRSGTLSWVRTSALVLGIAPALWIAWSAAVYGLGPRPVTAVIHQSGDWAIRLLIASLFISPLRRIMHWPKLIGARQIFGLAALAYASAHLLLYVVDQKFDLGRVLTEVVQRLYLGIGSMALIGLLILGATSGAAGVARLGGEGWNRLHRLVYPVTALALLHFFIQSKIDVTEPILLSGFALWLWGYRWIQARMTPDAGALAVLAFVSAAGTLAIELAWYGFFTRVPTSSIIEGLFDFEYEINILWYVFSVTLSLAAAQFLLQRTAVTRPAPRRPRVQGVQGV